MLGEDEVAINAIRKVLEFDRSDVEALDQCGQLLVKTESV